MDLGVAPEIANLIELYNDEPPMMLGSAEFETRQTCLEGTMDWIQGVAPRTATQI